MAMPEDGGLQFWELGKFSSHFFLKYPVIFTAPIGNADGATAQANSAPAKIRPFTCTSIDHSPLTTAPDSLEASVHKSCKYAPGREYRGLEWSFVGDGLGGR